MGDTTGSDKKAHEVAGSNAMHNGGVDLPDQPEWMEFPERQRETVEGGVVVHTGNVVIGGKTYEGFRFWPLCDGTHR